MHSCVGCAQAAPENDQENSGASNPSMSMSMRLKSTAAEGDGNDFKSALAKMYQNKRPASEAPAAAVPADGKKQRKVR